MSRTWARRARRMSLVTAEKDPGEGDCAGLQNRRSGMGGIRSP